MSHIRAATINTSAHSPRAAGPARDERAAMRLVQAVRRLVHRPGESLAQDGRETIQSNLGRSFRGVRVHRDADAAFAAEQPGARVFAVGSHVAFGGGQFASHTHEGEVAPTAAEEDVQTRAFNRRVEMFLRTQPSGSPAQPEAEAAPAEAEATAP